MSINLVPLGSADVVFMLLPVLTLSTVNRRLVPYLETSSRADDVTIKPKNSSLNLTLLQ